jgi:uncharacterized OB-fold protein
MKKLFNENVMREINGETVACFSRCKSCGKLSFPPEEHCGSCGSDMEIEPLPKNGELYSYTVMYRATKPFQPPHGLGQVQFDNGLLIQAIMQIDDPDALKKGDEFEIGSKVEIVTAPIAQDGEDELIGYKAVIVK